jgi:hypothetical protein
MKRWIGMLVFALALAGCGVTPPSDTTASRASSSHAKSGPKEIIALTDQKMVYECPKCGADYETAGACPMDGSALVATAVAYICPADNKPVEHSGACPRCQANARVEKTKVALAED